MPLRITALEEASPPKKKTPRLTDLEEPAPQPTARAMARITDLEAAPAPAAPPPARPRNPNVQYAPSGRVIDPSTGQPFPLRAAFAPPTIPGTNIRLTPQSEADVREEKLQGQFPAGGDVAAAGRTVARGVGPSIVQATPLLQGPRAVIKSITDVAAKERQRAGGKVSPKRQTVAVVKALRKSLPTALSAIDAARLRGEAVDWRPMASLREDPEYGANVRKMGTVPDVVDFALNWILDSKTGVLQSKVVGGAANLLGEAGVVVRGKQIVPGLNVMGRAEKAIPALGRVMEGRRGFEEARVAMDRRLARVENLILPQHAEWTDDIARSSARIGRKTLRTKDPLTKQPVNLLTRLVADWMDAGAKGARREGVNTAVIRGAPGRAAQTMRRRNELKALQAEAQALGVPWADVERIGKKGQALTDELGQLLVNAGVLDKGAYAAMRGSYLPRSYLLTSGSLKQRGQFIDLLEKNGAIGTEKARELRLKAGLLGTRGSAAPTRVHPQDFTDERELTEFAERVNPTLGRAIVPEATPVVTAYVRKGVRSAGEAAGQAEIAANPTLAVKAADVAAGRAPSPPPNWVPFTLNGEEHIVNPGVESYLRTRNDAGSIVEFLRRKSPEWADRYQRLQSFQRRAWTSAPKTAWNNGVGNYVLGESAAAIHGARYTPEGYLKAVAEWKTARRGGQAAPYLDEAMKETRILRGAALGSQPGVADFGGGFGVETLGRRAAQLPGKAFELYATNVYDDMEKSARYYLYKELRQAGKSVREAEKITSDVMITYSDVGPMVKALERNNITPFITFPMKAIGQYVNTALRRPDRAYTYTGERFRQTLDMLADDRARVEGREPVAKEKRRLGQVSPFEFPIPGMSDEMGKQQYAGVPALAPMLGGLLQGRAGQGEPSLVGGLVQAAAERFTTGLNPHLTLIKDLLTNKSTFFDRPIVPPGSIPGTRGGFQDVFTNPESAGKFTIYALKSIFPQATDLDRAYRAKLDISLGPLQVHRPGMPAYESATAPVPLMRATMLRALTGIRMEAGLGENPAEKDERVNVRLQRLKDNNETRFALKYMNGTLFKNWFKDKNYTPNSEYQRVADSYPDRELNDALDNAEEKLDFLLQRERPGPAKTAKIRDHMDWIWALNMAAGKKFGEQAQFMRPETRARFGGVLGGLPGAE